MMLNMVDYYNDYVFVLVFVFYTYLGLHLSEPFFLYDGWCSGIALPWSEMAWKSGLLQMQDSSSSNLLMVE